MTQVLSTRLRTSDIDSRIEKARRELADLEREEALEETRRQAELVIWYRQKWETFRPRVNLYLEIFPTIKELEADWRRDIFCGREKLEEQADQTMGGLYAMWLYGSRHFNEHAEYLTRHVAEDGLEELLNLLAKYSREGENLLNSWEPPALAKGYSFRAPALSQEAAARFRLIFPDT